MCAIPQYHEVNTFIPSYFTGEKIKTWRGLVAHVHTAGQVNRQLAFHVVTQWCREAPCAGSTLRTQVWLKPNLVTYLPTHLILGFSRHHKIKKWFLRETKRNAVTIKQRSVHPKREKKFSFRVSVIFNLRMSSVLLAKLNPVFGELISTVMN